MAIKDFQKTVRSFGGYVLSDGTCNLQHLLPKAFDLIRHYNLRGQAVRIAHNIVTSFRFEEGYEFDPKHSGLFAAQYHGHATLIEDDFVCIEVNNWLWGESVCDFFNHIAPSGYYFGTSEGDGACYGWFKVEDDRE